MFQYLKNLFRPGRLLLFPLLFVLISPVSNAAKREGPIRIGALTTAGGSTPQIVGLRDGLIELGYREDVDFTLGVRFTRGEPFALLGAARALVDFEADFIFSIGGKAAKAAQQATSRIPIIFVSVNDPLAVGLVNNYARPGGNITGLTDILSTLSAKRLQVFQELIPGLKRVLFVYNAANVYAVIIAKNYRGAAQRLGIELVEHPVRTQEEARKVLYGIGKGDVDGILSPRDPELNILGYLSETEARHGIPTMWNERFMVEAGGFAGYGPSFHEAGRLAARMVDKIIKGADPSEIPVEIDSSIEFTINLKTAKALGISVPSEMLFRADRIIR